MTTPTATARAGKMHTPTPFARYDGRWYFCWLIERNDGPQPLWLTPSGSWNNQAHQAMQFARFQDADIFKIFLDEPTKVKKAARVCEHGFDLGEERVNTRSQLLLVHTALTAALGLSNKQRAQLLAQNAALVEALRAWEHWYSVDSSEFNRDTAREMGVAALKLVTP